MNFYHRPRRLLLDGGGPPSDGSGGRGAAASFDANMVVILTVLLFALICALGINSMIRFFLRCARRVGTDGGGEAPRRRGDGKGLDKGLLSQIPVAVYGSGNGVAFTECPICLAEFWHGEILRVLPKCHHCFHVMCVDIWLASHTSCPTCRSSLAEEEVETGGGDAAVEVYAAVMQEGDVLVGHDGSSGGGGAGSVEEVG